MSERVDSLKQKLVSSSIWSGAGAILSRALDFVLLLVLSRILAPADFGLVAIATSIVALIETLTEIPLGAVIYNIKDITKRHLDTAFTMSLVRSLALLVVIVSLSSVAGLVYEDHRLTDILLLLALAPLVRSLQSPGMMLLAREVNFKGHFKANLVGKSVAFAIGVAVAFWLRNYWAIAIAHLASPFFVSLATYWIAPSKPSLSLMHWRYFMRSVSWLTMAQFLSAISWQFDRLFLGRVLTPASLGLYSMANNLAATVEQFLLRPMSQGPVLAGFASIRHDRARSGRMYLQALSTISIVGFLFMGLIASLSDQIVFVLFDERWAATAPWLSLFALSMLPGLLRVPFTPLVVALERTDLLVRIRLGGLVTQILAVTVGFWLFGVSGVIALSGVGNLLWLVVEFDIVRRMLDLSMPRILQSFARPVVACAVFPLVFFVDFSPWSVSTISAFLALSAVGAMAGSLFVLVVIGLWFAGGRPRGLEADIVARVRHWSVA